MQRTVSGPPTDLLTAEEVAEYLRVSEDTFERLVELKLFPPGIQVSAKKKVWPWMDCVAYAHLLGRMEWDLTAMTQKAVKGN